MGVFQEFNILDEENINIDKYNISNLEFKNENERKFDMLLDNILLNKNKE